MNLNNNNDFDSDDNDPLSYGPDEDFSNLPEELMEAAAEIAEKPFTHPDSPFRTNLDPNSVVSVATGYMMSNQWQISNWTCYVMVMRELIKDLPPYLARRATLALEKMNHVTVQSGQRNVQIGHAIQNSQ
jgi:hypothetical protein